MSNILEELQKAWNNAVTTESEKNAASPSSLEELKKAVEENNKSKTPERVTLPDAPEYEFMESKSVSDDELLERAKNSLSGYEAEKSKSIEEQTEAKRQSLEQQKVDAQKAAEERLGKIDEVYDAAKQSLDSDVLKRGLARSSIAVARSADLESGRADSLNAAQGEYATAIAQLQELLAGLESSKASELGALKAEMQSKIADKVETLREQAEKAAAEALKYNNTLREKQAQAQTDKLKDEEALYSQALSNALKEQKLPGAEDAEANRYATNYNMMDSLLSSMNRSDAAKLIKSDPFFRANLSEYLYYKLFDKYCY